MPNIRIKSDINGNPGTGGYFYADGKKIKPGEVAEVSEEDWKNLHEPKGLVEKVDGRTVRGNKPSSVG